MNQGDFREVENKMADNHATQRRTTTTPAVNNVTNMLNTKNNNNLQHYITSTSSLTNSITDTSSLANDEPRDVNDTSSTANEGTELQRFYNGAGVLVTGATGFMGKVLIEKLLRSCPGIRTVYLLVRKKKGKSINERIEELTSAACFDRLKEELPKFKSKLVAIAGDLGSAHLGISETDQHLLSDDVNIVFHVAATVRFDEKVKLAIEQNVTGTRELLNLCRTFKALKSVLHVSTAYANCLYSQVEEKFYEPPLDCDEAIRLADTFTTEMLDASTTKLLGQWPNTYAFTKAISENVIKKHSQGLPVGVLRPGIVVCTEQEPMPGWIDNLYGPTGVIVGAASGLLRVLNIDGEVAANIVPCDMAINAMIAAAWDVEQDWLSQQAASQSAAMSHHHTPPVYNYTSSDSNVVTWRKFINTYLENSVDYPISRAIWFASLTPIKNRSLYLMLRFFLHIIPAILMDAGLRVAGKKPQMVRVYEKIHKFSDVISYFSLREWHFTDANVYRLWDKMAAADKRLFPFDMRTVSWERTIKNSCPGLRRYIMQDPPHTLPQAKIRNQRLYWLHRTVQLFLISLVVWMLWVVLSSALPTTATSVSSRPLSTQSLS